MATSGMCLILFLVVCVSTSSGRALEEPKCTSRYDFESKLLRDTITLEFEMSQLQDKTTLALSKLDTLSMQLNEAQTSKLREIEEKTTSFEETRDNLANDFAKMYTEFESKTDSKWKEIEAQASKPSIAFLAHTVSDISPGKNTQLTFTKTVSNTGGGYDTSTGYFTAPVSGTYWFSVQMCPHYQKYVHVQIYADNTLIGSSVMYDGTSASACSTTSAVTVLNVGNKVHVKSGDSTTSGSVIYQSSNRWSVFSGALYH